jgi:hypothetical protein
LVKVVGEELARVNSTYLHSVSTDDLPPCRRRVDGHNCAAGSDWLAHIEELCQEGGMRHVHATRRHHHRAPSIERVRSVVISRGVIRATRGSRELRAQRPRALHLTILPVMALRKEKVSWRLLSIQTRRWRSLRT